MKLTRRTFSFTALAGLFAAPAASKVMAHHKTGGGGHQLTDAEMFRMSIRDCECGKTSELLCHSWRNNDSPIPGCALAHHEHPDKVKP